MLELAYILVMAVSDTRFPNYIQTSRGNPRKRFQLVEEVCDNSNYVGFKGQTKVNINAKICDDIETLHY